MTPLKVATITPFFRLNSLMTAFFCFGRHLAFFRHAGLAANAMPPCRRATPSRITRPEVVPSTLETKTAVEDGRHQGAERGAVAEHHRHAERHAEIAHREPEGEAAEAPQHAPEIAPEEASRPGFAEHAAQVGGHAAGRAPTGAMIQLKTPPTSQ